MKIPCISVLQPHTSLIAILAKGIETRSWSTKYRGLLGIHASKRFPRERQRLCNDEPFRTALWPLFGGYPKMLPLGCIIAVCELKDVVPTDLYATITIRRVADHLHLGSTANDAIGKAKATHQAALSRAETAEAMVEAAIENMAGASCIPDDDSPCMSPEYVRTEPDGIELPGSPPLEICRKCCSDHLSAKAKEALKS